MTEEELAWSLLPHEPLGFFGLQAGDDQRQLRRSYNRMIRRYKPEKFPTEFQRIRSAYEILSERLRYGHISQSGTAPSMGKDIGTPSVGNNNVAEVESNQIPTQNSIGVYDRVVANLANQMECLPFSGPCDMRV